MTSKLGARLLLGIALGLLLAGLATSAAYWTAERAAFLVTQEDYGQALAAAAGVDVDAGVNRATEHWEQVNRVARRVEAHAHLLFLCVVLILLAVLMDGAPTSRGQRLTVLAAASGILAYPAGLLVQASGQLQAGQGLAAVGAVLIIVVAFRVIASLFGRPATSGCSLEEKERKS